MFKLKKKKKEAAEGEGEAKEGEEKEAKKEAKEEAKEAEKPAAEGEAKEGEAAAEGEGGEGGHKKGKKKLIFIIVGALVLIGAIVGGLFAAGVIGGKKADKTETAQAVDKDGNPIVNKPVYYELPEFLVNLSNGENSNRTSFLKMQVTLELKDQASVAIVDANKPRIIDTFNTYLHELRPQDVQGSAGIYKLRDELMSRVNGTVQEGAVKDILFSEIIVQ